MYVFLRLEVLQRRVEDAVSKIVNPYHSRDESLARNGIPDNRHDEEEAFDVMAKVL